MKLKKLLNGPITTYKRFFTDKNDEEFQYLIQKEKWDEVSPSNEPNIFLISSWTHFVTILT
jgi:hypothetical protein